MKRSVGSYVKMTIDSGLSPMSLRYCPVNSCSSGYPIAYRSSVRINSIVLGEMESSYYMPKLERDPRGVELARWALTEAMRGIVRFEMALRHVSWVSVQIPVELILEQDLHKFILEVMDQNDFCFNDKLCLEFSPEIFKIDPVKARMAVLDMKLIGVKTMLSACGSYDAPVTSLLNVPVDMVLLTPEMTLLADNRDKPAVLSSFISYIRSMRIDVLAEGVYNDEQLTALSRAECMGYIPASAYTGKYSSDTDLDFDAAVAQKEDD